MFHNRHLDGAAAFSRSVGALGSAKGERNGIPSRAILH
jgi:hypothetical protein